MTKLKKKPTARQIFMLLVVSMWVVSFLTGIINPKYDPPDYVNPLIMLVGAYLFATNKEDK